MIALSLMPVRMFVRFDVIPYPNLLTGRRCSNEPQRSTTQLRATQHILCAKLHCATRQGERSPQVFKAAVAHSVDLSLWQTLHGLGIFNASVSAGLMNLNV
jgi:hypothetical protein